MLRNKSTCRFSFPLASVLAVSSLSLKCRSSSRYGDGFLTLGFRSLEVNLRFCALLCAERWPRFLDAKERKKERNVLASIVSLELYSVCAKDHSCYNISQSD